MTEHVPIVIAGAGPTGLGSAYRLQDIGERNFLVVEARDHAGGLASSYVDASGFTWDVGGHVHFSHYDYYDRMVEAVLGDRRLSHQREAWIWFKGRFVPYPFQYNLHHLDAADRDRALSGLELVTASAPPAVDSLAEWIDATFGSGLAGLFMRPYNEKVWGYRLETLDAGWIGERVAVPDLERVRRNILQRRDDASWGPNSRFTYPRTGGTGSLWRGVAAQLDATRFRWNSTVSGIDLRARCLQLEGGDELGYDSLITSIPLDRLCQLCLALDPAIAGAAKRLVHSAVHVIGIGLEGPKPEKLRTACWIYVPDAESPYHRVTVLSNYSPHNVPSGDRFWSLLAEVTETPVCPVRRDAIVESSVAALRRDGLIPASARVVSTWHRREEHGYPTPFRGRDTVLDTILPYLEGHGVYSRGRFGAWRYEVSNQDHCFMQGVEVVDRLLKGSEEVTVHRPELVNSGSRRTR